MTTRKQVCACPNRGLYAEACPFAPLRRRNRLPNVKASNNADDRRLVERFSQRAGVSRQKALCVHPFSLKTPLQPACHTYIVAFSPTKKIINLSQQRQRDQCSRGNMTYMLRVSKFSRTEILWAPCCKALGFYCKYQVPAMGLARIHTRVLEQVRFRSRGETYGPCMCHKSWGKCQHYPGHYANSRL